MKTFNQRLIAIIAIAFLGISVFSLKAQQQSSGNSQIPIYILGRDNSNRHMRPQAPSRQRIYCNYENGILYIEFNIPEGECLLTTNNIETNETTQYYFNSNFPAQINIGDISNAEIIISTSNGNTYQGFIE